MVYVIYMIWVSSGLLQGQRLWVQQTRVWHKEEVTINPTIEPPELTQDWENRLWEDRNRTPVHQDPEERSRDPT